MRFKKIYIEITNICNLSCSFCPELKRSPREMTCEEFRMAATDVRAFTDFIYLHLKGEPLAHSQIDNILTICDELDFKVNITTNGTLLDKKLDILNKHKSLRQVNVSLHSAETVEKAEKYVCNIIKCAEILSKNTMVSLRIWTYDQGANAVNNRMIEMLQEHFNKTIPLTGQRFTLAKNIFFNLGDTFQWPSPLLPELSENGYCLGTRSHIGILSCGTVVPCCLDSEGDINLGNVFETGLDEILKSERFLGIYNGFSERKIKESLCRKCSFRLRFDS